MAFRWRKGSSPLQTIKRGIASLFVCTVVLLPLILAGLQIAGWLGIGSDSRPNTPLSAMQVRALDKSAGPIKPFEQPLITVTFDDGWETIYTEAFPLLQKYGIPTTQYVLSGTSKDINYMSFQQMINASKAGHDVQCHSIDHSNLTLLSQKDLYNQLATCKTDIEKRVGVKVTDFASPYGASNSSTIVAIQQSYRSHRNTNGDISTNEINEYDINIKSNFDRYNIIAVTIRRETTIEQLQAAIDYTIKNNGWLVLNYHQVDDGPSQFGLDSTILERQLQVISNAKARIATMDQVLDTMEY
jgi:peptidoglycan/xylan/chitin deacetylase (PgdA/CDA1 family)